jgi:hypothetical protein
MTKMTDAEIEALEAAARAATPGEWRSHSAAWWMIRTDATGIADVLDGNPLDAHFIIATQPAALLRLIARLRDAEQFAVDLAVETLSDEGPEFTEHGIWNFRRRIAAISSDEYFDKWRKP